MAKTMEEIENEIKQLEFKKGYVGDAMIKLREMLSKAGISVPYSADPTVFDEGLEQAVMEFQRKYKLEKITGIVDYDTRTALSNAIENMSDIIYSENVTEEAEAPDSELSGNPHFDSFFSKEYDRDARKNNQDIVIVLGKNSVTKTIHNVYMRGVSTEYDTSGNPISEVYEFIGQDLTESTELKDKDKYK